MTSAARGSTGQLVSVQLASRLAVTLSLVIGAIILTAIFSVILGILAARRGGAVDGTVQFLSILGFAIPGFLIALFLVLIFAINLGWFKATGYIPLTTSFTGWLSSVTLPIIALAIGGYRDDLAAGARLGASTACRATTSARSAVGA